MHRLVPVLLASLLAIPLGTMAGDPTLAAAAGGIEAAIEEGLRARLDGALPTTLTVDAGHGPREVPFDEAMALLRANARPRLAGISPPASPQDVGYGVRSEGGPCYVAVVVTAYAFTDTDALLFEEPTLAVPDRDVPCGPGFRSWIGDARVQVGSDAAGVEACVALEGFFGAWARIPGNCYYDGYSRVVLDGRVGFVDARTCGEGWCFVLQQAFGGTINGPRTWDAALISIE